MPFVTREHREHPDLSIPGDRTYVYYRLLIDMWNKEKRWTTIDKMAETFFPKMGDEQRAKFLAFLVFMHFIGFKYEEQKCRENGPIE